MSHRIGPDDYADMFGRLIADDVGHHATRIVDALRSPMQFFPMEFTVAGEQFTYTIGVTVWDGRFRIETELYNLFVGKMAGPVVDVPRHPADWTKLEVWRVANLIDTAFRGHELAFDSNLP